MTIGTKVKGSREIEAIEHITRLLEMVKSSDGIELVGKAFIRSKKLALERELLLAKKKVSEIEESLSFLRRDVLDNLSIGSSAVEEDENIDKPVFDRLLVEEAIYNAFVEDETPGHEFTMTQIKKSVAMQLELTDYQRDYITPVGSNLFSASIRNTLRSMTKRGRLFRVKPGIYSAPFSKAKEQIDSSKSFVAWKEEA